jgi:hypothetical protein
VLYGIFALGWRGSARHWQRYEIAYLLLAGLSTPLVVSVHSIVSLDFAVSQLPGWHTTIFPPYFVAGAIFSGFAMVLTWPSRCAQIYGLEGHHHDKHLDAMSKVMLATGLIVAYGYAMEAFFAWYSGNPYERYMMWNRMTGPYGGATGLLITCNVVIPQLLWFKRVRTAPVPCSWISIVINIGMWLERFVIIVTSLHRDFVPSSWGMYSPTQWDWLMFLGTMGFFCFNMMLFMKFLPMISLFEVRWVSSIAYPHLVAGRPLFSWPNFIPVVFECTVLCSALTAVIGMFGLNGLPLPYHPVFSVPRIEMTSTDTFMLFVSATDAQFDVERTAAFLRSLGSAEVHPVHVEPSGVLP